MKDPFRYFKTSPEFIHLAVMMYVCFGSKADNQKQIKLRLLWGVERT